MRTIKFRGKPISKDSWAYGDLMHCTDNGSIPSELIEIDGVYCEPETVGQFTGLYDKNGKEIYEGDIVNLEGGYIGIVVWDIYFCGWVQECIKPVQFSLRGKTIGMFNGREYEVIGNIYDNPELLKEQDE